MISNPNVILDNNYALSIIPNVNAINLSSSEISKLKVFLRDGISSEETLFNSQLKIYSFIGANFNIKNFYIIIPFMNNKQENLNIIGYKPEEVIV